jgi:ComF family protein
MNFRALISHLLNVVFPARRKPGRRWESMTADYFESAVTKATHDAVLSRAGAIALFSYNDPLVKEAMHALKYNGQPQVAALFGELVADYLKEELADRALLHDAPTLLIPIPVTFGRHIERSYNQTELIAAETAQRLPGQIEYIPNILVRQEFHGSNALAASRRERSSNVRGVFDLKDADIVAGRDIILLDDIITTGATTHEATATLLGCGARSVSCIAVAH